MILLASVLSVTLKMFLLLVLFFALGYSVVRFSEKHMR